MEDSASLAVRCMLSEEVVVRLRGTREDELRKGERGERGEASEAAEFVIEAALERGWKVDGREREKKMGGRGDGRV